MHESPRLRQRRLHQQPEHALELAGFLAVQRDAEVPRQVPVAEQARLAPQQRRVVGRQARERGGLGLRARLQLHERAHRVGKQLVDEGRVGAGQRLQEGLRAEVRQQQEALGEVLGHDLGRVEAPAAQQPRDGHERPAILLLRRRVHHDPAAGAVARASLGHPKVAAKAGVGGGRGEGDGGAVGDAELRERPAPGRLGAGIGRIHRGAKHTISLILSGCPSARCARCGSPCCWRRPPRRPRSCSARRSAATQRSTCPRPRMTGSC